MTTLDELERLEREATAGEWRREMMELGPGGPMTLGVGTEERPVCIVHGIVESPIGIKNADFIASIRNQAAYLLRCARFVETHGRITMLALETAMIDTTAAKEALAKLRAGGT